MIVCAHPDDEVLWFSSLLKTVDWTIICYLGSESDPLLGEGRAHSLAEHPIKAIECLDISESDVFNDSNWVHPSMDNYGLVVDKSLPSYQKYLNNYSAIKKKLSIALSGYKNVFTHNPWGEYGNEEHIQLFTIIKQLKENMGFNLWFSNYCSTKSCHFMSKHFQHFSSEYFSSTTDPDLTSEIIETYKRNNCWTWYDHWQWNKEETFIKYSENEDSKQHYGTIIPLNLIKVEPLYIPVRRPSLIKRAFSRLHRYMPGKK